MNRRGFLVGILAAGMAPAVVRAASLMKVVSPTGLMVPVPFDFHDNFMRAMRHQQRILNYLHNQMIESAELSPLRQYGFVTKTVSRQELARQYPRITQDVEFRLDDQSRACPALVVAPA